VRIATGEIGGNGEPQVVQELNNLMEKKEHRLEILQEARLKFPS
jgi:hypothetical protein